MAEVPISSEMISAARIVILANSPNYVFTRLRTDPTVQATYFGLTAEEIFSWLKSNLSTEAVTLDDLARRYVYLIALSLKDPAESLTALDELDLSKLEWGEELRRMIKATAIGSIQTEFRAATKSSVTFSGAGVGHFTPSSAPKIQIIEV